MAPKSAAAWSRRSWPFDLARYEANLHRRPFYVGHSPYIHGTGSCPFFNSSFLPGGEAPPIVFRSAQTTQLVWRVLRGELQAGFGVWFVVDKALWIERVAHEPFCVCISVHHRFAANSLLGSA